MQGTVRLLAAAGGGTLAWLADQPWNDGYNPLIALAWNARFWEGPSLAHAAMFLAWFMGAVCCHFLLFALGRLLSSRGRRAGPAREA